MTSHNFSICNNEDVQASFAAEAVSLFLVKNDKALFVDELEEHFTSGALVRFNFVDEFECSKARIAANGNWRSVVDFHLTVDNFLLQKINKIKFK